MSLAACAEIVRKGDPDRFLAAMAAAPRHRAVLFPLYAFNLELARAPLVTPEPMIAEMRLQWWRDVLAEIAAGGPVRRHEVATPLAEALDPATAQRLDALAEARRRDISAEPFASAAELTAYLDATSGTLLAAAAARTGAADPDAPAIVAHARAQGLANWFLAAPALAALGRQPIPEPAEATIRTLADESLTAIAAARPDRTARPALLATWRAPSLLRQARAEPARVLEGRLAQSEFARRLTLLAKSLRL